MERQLLAAALKSRSSFEKISEYITLTRYERPFQIVWEMVTNYYEWDANAQTVQPDLLIARIKETVRNDKHVRAFTELVEEAAALDVSEANVEQVVLEAKRTEYADELALALTNGKPTQDLLEKYASLQEMTSLEELAELGTDEFDVDSLGSILEEAGDGTGRLVLYPRAINDRLDGGVAGGHHIVVYARPETGKTALCISIAAGFARQGAPGLYFGNEDRPQDLMLRTIYNLTGLTRQQVLSDMGGAQAAAIEAGIGNIRMISMAPGTPKQIEAYIKKYQPRWIIVDQLRNVSVKSDGRVNQLEAAATAMRNIAKKYNIIVVSVTQAGDSASNKEVLDMGDVDFSNTGIPAQADLMIGMGVTPALEAQGVRMISLPKNKIGGDHSHFLVRLNQFLSRVTSME